METRRVSRKAYSLSFAGMLPLGASGSVPVALPKPAKPATALASFTYLSGSDTYFDEASLWKRSCDRFVIARFHMGSI
jgi:hypothetical protein